MLLFIYIYFFSAGIGRTGTYIALDILTEQGKQLGYIDAAACVELLRKQRVNMIQNLVFTILLRYICSTQSKILYDSQFVLRKVRILTLPRDVRIFAQDDSKIAYAQNRNLNKARIFYPCTCICN